MVRMTEEILNAGRSQRGGWSKDQLFVLGIIGFPKGWKSRVLGKSYRKDTILEFLRLKDLHLRDIWRGSK